MDYSSFSEITNPNLKAYNIVIFLNNLLEDKGKAYAEDYLKQFDKDTIEKAASIALSIQTFGRRKVLDLITKDLLFVEYPTDAEIRREALANAD